MQPGLIKTESERNAANTFLDSLSGDPMLARSSGAEDALRHVLRERGGGRSATEGRAMAIQQRGQQQQQQQQMMAVLGMVQRQLQIREATEQARAEVPELVKEDFYEWAAKRYPHLKGKRVPTEFMDRLRSQHATEQSARLEMRKIKLRELEYMSLASSRNLAQLNALRGNDIARDQLTFDRREADTKNTLARDRFNLERDKFNRPPIPKNIEEFTAGRLQAGDEPGIARGQRAQAKFRNGKAKQPTTVQGMWVHATMNENASLKKTAEKQLAAMNAPDRIKSQDSILKGLDTAIDNINNRIESVPADVAGGRTEAGETMVAGLETQRSKLQTEYNRLSKQFRDASLGEMRDFEAKKGANGAASKKGAKSDLGSVAGIKAAFKSGKITADQAELHLEHLQGK